MDSRAGAEATAVSGTSIWYLPIYSLRSRSRPGTLIVDSMMVTRAEYHHSVPYYTNHRDFSPGPSSNEMPTGSGRDPSMILAHLVYYYTVSD